MDNFNGLKRSLGNLGNKQDIYKYILDTVLKFKGEFTKEQVIEELKKVIESKDLEKLVEDNLKTLNMTGIIRKTKDNKYTK